jgi:hypothetical protein
MVRSVGSESVYAEGIGGLEVYRMFCIRNFDGRAREGFYPAYPPTGGLLSCLSATSHVWIMAEVIVELTGNKLWLGGETDDP